MNSIDKNKWQVRIAAIMIFLLGGLAGALALHTYRAWQPAMASRPDRFAQMLDRLNLSAEQKTRVEQILSDSRKEIETLRRESEPRMRDVRRETDERLREVLTPTQWEQFQQMKNEIREHRRRGPRRGGS